jgi:murein DD-endopeptidase MepM/ murein hydrolase activator NlpD
MRYVSILAAIAALILVSCNQTPPETPEWSEYDPFAPAGGMQTAIPLSTLLAPQRSAGTPIVTPTPDFPHFSAPTAAAPIQYVVQPGDTLGGIAEAYGVSTDALVAANSLPNPNLLSPGEILTIPQNAAAPSFKIIPDSELVYSPTSLLTDVPSFVESQGGYLATYQEEVHGDILSGAEIVQRIAENYSVNPRLLLALLEYQSGWVTNPAPVVSQYPMGYMEAWYEGLYRQLAWTANELNRGYYLWKINAVDSWTLADGNVIPASPTINAGTAGVQNFFAGVSSRAAWTRAISEEGVFSTYQSLFGYPFDYLVEPLLPFGLMQPTFTLPFAAGETWFFTGGPHGGWDDGSAWAALDFAPPDTAGCAQSAYWVLAIADGVIVRAENGAVVEDLDGDGYEETGWTILYMHIASDGRIAPGSRVHTGDKIGHPSCEGGLANAAHLHLARRYNGEWIPADGEIPFVLDGWSAVASDAPYDGFLVRGEYRVEAWNGRNPENEISR